MMRSLFRALWGVDSTATRKLAQVLDRDFNRACDCDLARSLGLDFGHAVELELEVDSTLAISHVLNHLLTGAEFSNHHVDLAEALNLTDELSRSIDRIRRRIIHGDPAVGTNPSFGAALEKARQRVAELFQQLAASREQPGEAARVHISPLAGRAADAAARLLPRCDRLRYSEEYRAELYELAFDSRRAQWGYAVRLLACALPLRRELRRDAREVVQGQ